MPRGGTGASLGMGLEDIIGAGNGAIEVLQNLRNEIVSVQQTTMRNTSQINSVIETLLQGMDGIRTAITDVAQRMGSLSSASAQNRQSLHQTAATMDEVWKVYEKMGLEVDSLRGSIKALELTDKEMSKVVQLGNVYNQQRSDSYTALSEKYRAMKILIDNMTKAEREETEAGKALVTQSRAIYEQMNLLQQATGKYQLQVGDYSKAMTGLRIATNQVVRELPVLANGVSMFAIAISNNIPIWADAISQVNREYEANKIAIAEHTKAAEKAEKAGDLLTAAAEREAAAAVKLVKPLNAVVNALKGWQTWLVILLSVLPALIRNIEKKKKAQEEANKATEEAVKYEKLLADAETNASKQRIKSVSELETLYRITQDNNRSWEERVRVAQVMKGEFEEELANLSAEEIALGNAKEAIQNLVDVLMAQAEARAYLNEIENLTIRHYELEKQKIAELAKVRNLEASLEVEAAKKRIAAQKAIDEVSIYGETTAKTASELNVATDAVADLQKQIDEASSSARGFDSQMQDVENTISDLRDRISGFALDWDKDKGGGGKGLAAALGNIPDLYYEMLQASAEALPYELDRNLAILEVGWMKQRDAYAKQIDDLAQMRDAANADEAAEINQQIEYLINLLKLGQDKYDAEVKQIIKDRIASYAEEVVEDVVGEDIPEQIQEKMWSRRGRKYGGIVEAILAQTSKYGEGNKFGQGILKDEYVNFVTSVDQALKTSMGFMDDWMDKRLEMAKIAVEAAEKEVQAAQKVLDFEMEARANGYANRVETARKELDLEREQHRKALEEQRRLQNEQLLLDSISQASSLVTATANIWEAMTKGTGVLGPGLAIAATALLWGSYAASKVKAAQLAKMQSEQYGEGTVELLEGGSHASGHDIDLGVKKDGTRRRAEGGEFFAVINRRNSRKYRNVIPDVINSFNDGTFGDKYYNANAAMGNFALGLLAGGSPTDVSKLERDVRAIREQGDEHRYIDSMGNTIIRYKNLTRKIQK